MSAVSFSRCLDASDWIFGWRSTVTHRAAKIATATTKIKHSAPPAIAARLTKLSKDRSRMGRFYVGRDPKRRDRGEQVRQVHRQVHQEAHRIEMRNEEHDDVDAVPDSQRPEVDARRLRG